MTWNLPNGEPNTIDPALSALENISTVDGNICEGLMRFTSDYQMKPNLASSVETPNDTTVVFTIRPNVKFWDGHTLTAADVVYSMQRVANPKTGSAWASAYPPGTEILQTGPMQVTVKLPAADALFHWYEATPAMNVVEKSYAEKAGKKFGSPSGGVMCTGPFKFTSWQQGESITISKNHDYWDQTRRPRIDTLKYTFDADASSQTAAMVRGDVDGQFGNSVSSFSQLRNSGSGSLLFGSSLSPTFAQMFGNAPPMDNVDLRAALRSVVDYQGIAKSVFGGAAVPIKTITPPATWGYAKNIFQAAYDALPEARQDLAAAKKDVAAAGQPAEPIVLGYDSTSPEETKIALSIGSAADEVGLKVKLKALTATAYNALFYTTKTPAGLSGYIVTGYLDFPEPLEYDQYATTGSYYNYGDYKNNQYNSLLEQAEVTLDDTARAKLITRAEAIYAKSNYSIPIVSPYLNVFVNKRLTGVMPSPTYLYTAWADTLGAK